MGTALNSTGAQRSIGFGTLNLSISTNSSIVEAMDNSELMSPDLRAIKLTLYVVIFLLNIKNAKWIIFGIWIASLISVTPYISVLKKDGESGRCDEDWPSKSARKTYTACLFVFEYLFSRWTVIAGAYVSIGWELARRARNGNRFLQDLQAEEAKKVVRMLKVVTLIFAVCVLPNNIMWMWLDFGKADEQYDKFWDLVAFCNIITFANSAANPICYTILNESYRNAFKDHLSKIFYKIFGRPSGVRKDFMRADNDGSEKKSRTATMMSAL
ncbi:hypothetical protein OS493_028662 [Desmophyllum pertusum]|uniref:G-protein coupled receptors family 1 profile domain-containing protein n=1 Tax=Desmophyllum pertusum TaxID=174260 RepID=A0A9W9YKH6_9CNID|nr:hypothetical protein OS493_028662 [Desmophyllum pertusum]